MTSDGLTWFLLTFSACNLDQIIELDHVWYKNWNFNQILHPNKVGVLGGSGNYLLFT